MASNHRRAPRRGAARKGARRNPGANSVFQRYLELARQSGGVRRNPAAPCEKQSPRYNKYVGAKVHRRGGDIDIVACSTTPGAYWGRKEGAKRGGADIKKTAVHQVAWRGAGRKKPLVKFQRPAAYAGFGRGVARTKERALQIAKIRGLSGADADALAKSIMKGRMTRKAERVAVPSEKTVKKAVKKSAAAREAGVTVAKTLQEKGASKTAANKAAAVAAVAVEKAEKKGIEISPEKIEKAAEKIAKTVVEAEASAKVAKPRRGCGKKKVQKLSENTEKAIGNDAGKMIVAESAPAAAVEAASSNAAPAPSAPAAPGLSPFQKVQVLQRALREKGLDSRGNLASLSERAREAGIPIPNPGRGRSVERRSSSRRAPARKIPARRPASRSRSLASLLRHNPRSATRRSAPEAAPTMAKATSPSRSRRARGGVPAAFKQYMGFQGPRFKKYQSLRSRVAKLGFPTRGLKLEALEQILSGKHCPTPKAGRKAAVKSNPRRPGRRPARRAAAKRNPFARKPARKAPRRPVRRNPAKGMSLIQRLRLAQRRGR